VSNLLASVLAGVVALGPVSAVSETPTPDGACAVSDVAIAWGFKESFRSYISSSIALGSWSTTGDVGYNTPVFTLTGGDGFLAPDRGEGQVSFGGGLVFTGHGGILNTSLDNPRLVLDGPREATLFFDVTGDTMDMVSVSATDVDFVSIRWSGANDVVDSEAGTWTITQAEVVLNQAGSTAFGTYAAGEIFDPMDISLTVTPGCLSEPLPLGWWVAGATAVITAAVAALVVANRRGRRGPEPERQ
jgi:hypothetical protein